MADTAAAIERLKESQPPATDTFTYLTIIEKSLSPEILPALHEILEDASLTADIGWDLVEMLISVPGSEECLETIARLGNPREVILKVLEVLENMAEEDGEEEEEEEEGARGERLGPSKKFITLLGMLGILHKRLEVKAPSRFVHQTLQTVYRAYNATDTYATAAVIDLTRSLSGQRRPPLPTRKSSTKLEPLFHESDPSRSAPDPEADKAEPVDPVELILMTRLLRAFITCVIEAFVNFNNVGWATRLEEFHNPTMVVPRKRSMIQTFKEDPAIAARDSLMGQLAALADDLGLSEMESSAITDQLNAPIVRDPLSVDPDPENPNAIKLSTAGFWCLTAYCTFATAVFDAGFKPPSIHLFPDHFSILQHFLGDAPQEAIATNPGTAEALVVLGKEPDGRPLAAPGVEPHYMEYIHLLTLMAVFHPALGVRSAATALAGAALRADPDEADRLKILQDLLENCDFAALRARAVAWLKDELVAARGTDGGGSPFAGPEAVETLQYALFPALGFLKGAEPGQLWECLVDDHPFHLQVANFLYLLFAPGSNYGHLVPAGMGPAVEQRYVDPLLAAAKALEDAMQWEKDDDEGGVPGQAQMQLLVLTDRLKSISFQ